MPNSDLNPLARYWEKRDFNVTAEPKGERVGDQKSYTFVIQKHAASRLHYDFRLELDGVLVSWAVPKGPSFDPVDKRMAIHVEDHPLSYASFEGTIPAKQYGAGTVIVWDYGIWQPVGDPREGLSKGKLVFQMYGQKMAGLWELVKISKAGEKQEAWLLFKKRDEYARPKADFDVVSALPDSVIAKPLTPPHSSATGRGRVGHDVLDSNRGGRHFPADLLGALKAVTPDVLSPQLATLATGIPATGDWLYEIKFDGYRMMTRIDKGRIKLITSGGHDWSAKLPNLVRELEQLDVKSGWLDGEVVMLGEDGLPDFHSLQKSFDQSNGTGAVVYYLFDVPFLDDYDLRQMPLVQRRQILKTLLEKKGSEHLRFSEAFDADPASILTSACQMSLEGIMAKRKDAPYSSIRTETWLKLKCKQRQEFIVCGYTDRSNSSTQVGSLLLGVHTQDAGLVSVGRVGSGWNATEAHELKLKLAKLRTATCAFEEGAPKTDRWSNSLESAQHWVEPLLVAEVEFAQWTPNGQIRHASYIGLRTDKPAKAITREKAKTIVDSTPLKTNDKALGNLKVTHGERIIDSESGLTKLDLIRYYESVAEWILPHLKGRPCSLVRGPTGVDGELFFQKHGEQIGIPGVKELNPNLWPDHEALLEVGSLKALINAAQMNVIEFHTWNSLAKNFDKPDRMIFDLDPGEGTVWSHVQEAAMLVRTLLSELGLESWLKTSGGKGLHVVVPLAPKFGYDTVKAFSKAIVQHLAGAIPSRFVAKSGPANRVGKLFVDYLRNGRGATTAAAFSARARPGLGVSMPVAWDDLSNLKSGAQWTVANAREHLSFQTVDPWSNYWVSKQNLTGAMSILDFEPELLTSRRK